MLRLWFDVGNRRYTTSFNFVIARSKLWFNVGTDKLERMMEVVRFKL